MSLLCFAAGVIAGIALAVFTFFCLFEIRD